MNTLRPSAIHVAHRVRPSLMIGCCWLLTVEVAPADPVDMAGRRDEASRISKSTAVQPSPAVAVRNTDPYIDESSNSGCLNALDGDPNGVYPFCEEDRMDLTPGPQSLHVLHANVTYNCCMTDVLFALSVINGVIHLEETEVTPMPCDCMCCFHVEAHIVNLPPGSYFVELCWWDWEESGHKCLVEDGVVIPPDIGACCQDISDGPVPYETCDDTAPGDCVGLFHESASCGELQACCLANNLCQDMNPHCCTDSRGVAMGGASICADLGVCPPLCDAIGVLLPCPNGTFCEFPIGMCDDVTAVGACIDIPQPGCPEYLHYVCGCDGVTYENECFARQAGVSLAHEGMCDPAECAGTRDFASLGSTFCPGVPLDVQIHLSPKPGATAYTIADKPPTGWEVTFISHDGTFDETTGKVKWGPLFLDDPGFPRSVSYTVIPTMAPGSAAACFEGAVAVDGYTSAICGDQCVTQQCCERMQADLPQPPCADCPYDCSSCADGTCGDGRITMCELTSYACAWKVGCNDDMAGMTRAAYIWKNGECYCYSAADNTWHTTVCPPPASGCCDE